MALFTLRHDGIAVLARRTALRGERWELPRVHFAAPRSLRDHALRAVRDALHRPPAWLRQVGAFELPPGRRGGAFLAVAFAAVAPRTVALSAVGEGWTWKPVDRSPPMAPHHMRAVHTALRVMREMIEVEPVVFQFLAPTFTLAELQRAYEAILGRRLHKASFRRALRAAAAVTGTGKVRQEGRGRPAQLFRLAPAASSSSRAHPTPRLDRLGRQ